MAYSKYHPQPNAMRLIYLQDRLVLEDITPYLNENADPSQPNVLIDISNRLSMKPPYRDPIMAKSKFLVLPFQQHYAVISNTVNTEYSSDVSIPLIHSFQTSDPVEAGLIAPETGQPRSFLALDVALGILGLLPLPSGWHALFVAGSKRIGSLPFPNSWVYIANKIKVVKLSPGQSSSQDKEIGSQVARLMESSLYYCCQADLTQSLQKQFGGASPGDTEVHGNYRREGTGYWWTFPMARNLGPKTSQWALRTIYGFVGMSWMSLAPSITVTGSAIQRFVFMLISRRSRRRAGTRFITRGVDSRGDVANFVESEQVIWPESVSANTTSLFTSFRILRGSIPVFWRQNNHIAKPHPELDPPIASSRLAFSTHMNHLVQSYGAIVAVSLVNLHGVESVLAVAWQRHFALDIPSIATQHQYIPKPKLVTFDFHQECAGSEYARGLQKLMASLREDLKLHRVFVYSPQSKSVLQRGAFRVNCVDCLDRTGVVQSALAHEALFMQIRALFGAETMNAQTIHISPESEEYFKKLWADNADAISRQYSGTGAMKSDFTRTGKRSTTGMVADGFKSVARVYYKNVVDDSRQDGTDLLCFYAKAIPLPRETTGIHAVYKDAQRVGSGGDREAVVIVLRDEAMYVATPEGLRYEYPRSGLMAWARLNEREERPRLRLTFSSKLVEKFPAASTCQDFQFKKGFSERELFLRTLITWAAPSNSKLFAKPFRIRVFCSTQHCPLTLEEWGVGAINHNHPELLCFISVNAPSNPRKWNLEAVPANFENQKLHLVSSVAASHNTCAVAVLSTASLAQVLMDVNEDTLILGGSEALSIVSLSVAGTTVCFLGCMFSRREYFADAINKLKFGLYGYDAVSQFDVVYAGGQMGIAESTGDSFKWTTQPDGSQLRSYSSESCVLRKVNPTVFVKDLISQPEQLGRYLCVDEVYKGRVCPGKPEKAQEGILNISSISIETTRIPSSTRVPGGLDFDVPFKAYLNLHSNLLVSSSTIGLSQSLALQSEVIYFLPSDPAELETEMLRGQLVMNETVMGYFSFPLRTGEFVIPISQGFEGRGIMRISLAFAMNTTNPESSILSKAEEIHSTDLSSKRTNTRKVKNFMGKVANYWNKSNSTFKPSYVSNDLGLSQDLSNMNMGDEDRSSLQLLDIGSTGSLPANHSRNDIEGVECGVSDGVKYGSSQFLKQGNQPLSSYGSAENRSYGINEDNRSYGMSGESRNYGSSQVGYVGNVGYAGGDNRYRASSLTSENLGGGGIGGDMGTSQIGAGAGRKMEEPSAYIPPAHEKDDIDGSDDFGSFEFPEYHEHDKVLTERPRKIGANDTLTQNWNFSMPNQPVNTKRVQGSLEATAQPPPTQSKLMGNTNVDLWDFFGEKSVKIDQPSSRRSQGQGNPNKASSSLLDL